MFGQINEPILHRCSKLGGVNQYGSCTACFIEKLQAEISEIKIYCDVHGIELQKEACNHVRPCELCILEAKNIRLTAEWRPISAYYEQRVNENGHLETRPIEKKGELCLGLPVSEE